MYTRMYISPASLNGRNPIQAQEKVCTVSDHRDPTPGSHDRFSLRRILEFYLCRLLAGDLLVALMCVRGRVVEARRDADHGDEDYHGSLL